jgi:hypothetical protein
MKAVWLSELLPGQVFMRLGSQSLLTSPANILILVHII